MFSGEVQCLLGPIVYKMYVNIKKGTISYNPSFFVTKSRCFLVCFLAIIRCQANIKNIYVDYRCHFFKTPTLHVYFGYIVGLLINNLYYVLVQYSQRRARSVMFCSAKAGAGGTKCGRNISSKISRHALSMASFIVGPNKDMIRLWL